MSEFFKYAVIAFATPSTGIVLAALIVIWFFATQMRPRRFYIVRHGETLLNAEHIKQGAEGGLNYAGKEQAERAGEKLAPFGIKKIISSPYQRARETSEILNKHLRASIVYTPLLAERRNPSEVIGKDRDDTEVKKIIDQMDLSYHPDEYRFSDEENFIDLKKRAKKCLSYLAREDAPDNCIVTHHAFLKMLLAYMTYRERLHAADFVKLSFFNTSDNGGVSICEYRPWEQWNETRGWEVLSFNDAL